MFDVAPACSVSPLQEGGHVFAFIVSEQLLTTFPGNVANRTRVSQSLWGNELLAGGRRSPRALLVWSSALVWHEGCWRRVWSVVGGLLGDHIKLSLGHFDLYL